MRIIFPYQDLPVSQSFRERLSQVTSDYVWRVSGRTSSVSPRSWQVRDCVCVCTARASLPTVPSFLPGRRHGGRRHHGSARCLATATEISHSPHHWDLRYTIDEARCSERGGRVIPPWEVSVGEKQLSGRGQATRASVCVPATGPALPIVLPTRRPAWRHWPNTAATTRATHRHTHTSRQLIGV